MKSATTVLLLGLALAVPAAATTAQVVDRDSPAVHAAQVLQKQTVDQRHADQHGERGIARLATPGFGGANGPYANPYRTYPPSCMADPLPLAPDGTTPVYRSNIDMASYNQTLGGYVREPVTIEIWRLPCSSSGAYDNAITLMRIQRRTDHEGDANQYVMFPGVRVAQGSVGFDNPDGFDLPRIAPEPNTIVSWTPVDSPVVDSTTYVLEAYPLPNRPVLDYTRAFKIRFDNFINDGKAYQYVINVPAWKRPAPLVGQALPINGYMTNYYYNPDYTSEGVTVLVYEMPGSGSYILGFHWFTFGPNGKPYWITGTAGVNPGARTATATEVGYLEADGAEPAEHPWGKVTFRWPDCNHLEISFDARSDLPGDVPQGSGERTWNRVANLNGLTCE